MGVLEQTVTASVLPKEKKVTYLEKASIQLDLLKFFLQISWEIGVLQTKHYSTLSEHLSEIGRMLGGWRRGVESKTSAR